MTTPQEPGNDAEAESAASANSEIADMISTLQGDIDIFGKQAD